PFGTVVITMRKKILGDDRSQPRSDFARSQGHREDEESAEYDRNLNDNAPAARIGAKERAYGRYRKQKDSTRDEGGRMEHSGSRHVYVDPPIAIPRHRQRDQRNGKKARHGTHR